MWLCQLIYLASNEFMEPAFAAHKFFSSIAVSKDFVRTRADSCEVRPEFARSANLEIYRKLLLYGSSINQPLRLNIPLLRL